MTGLAGLFAGRPGGGRALRAAWLDLPSPAAARIAAGSGLDLAVIDREHGAIGVETAAAMTDAVAARRMGVLTRVPELSTAAIQQALDAGADGVIVPKVESAAEARRAASLTRYPPDGARGFAAGVIAASGYGADADYAARWNAEALLAVQIETQAGLAAAAEIADVPGVGMLFFGPFDYAVEAGISPADGAALRAVFARIAAAAHRAGRLAGAFPWPGATAAELAEAGADLAVAASDVALLREGFAAAAT